MCTRVLQQNGMSVWNVTASSVSYTPLTSPPASSSSTFSESSLSFLSDRRTVVRSLGTEEEEEVKGDEGEGEEVEGGEGVGGERESDDISALFSHSRIQGENDNENENKRSKC